MLLFQLVCTVSRGRRSHDFDKEAERSEPVAATRQGVGVRRALRITSGTEQDVCRGGGPGRCIVFVSLHVPNPRQMGRSRVRSLRRPERSYPGAVQFALVPWMASMGAADGTPLPFLTTFLYIRETLARVECCGGRRLRLWWEGFGPRLLNVLPMYCIPGRRT